jgi:Uma2 family endonuclease
MDVRRKVRDCLRADSQEVWLVDHSNAEVLVHTKTEIRVLQRSNVLESPLLPGFNAAVADLVVNC